MLLSHGSRDVHHEDDDRVGLGIFDFLPTAVADVLTLRDDDRVVRVIIADHDLAFERFLERSLEMAERFRPDAPDAAVFIANGRDAVLPLGFDARELQFLGQNLRQFV